MSAEPPFVPIVVGREIKRTTFPSPNGPIEGYQMRFQLSTPNRDGSVLDSWTDWLHLPNPLMVYLVESLDEFMRVEGHWAEQGVVRDPGSASG